MASGYVAYEADSTGCVYGVTASGEVLPTGIRVPALIRPGTYTREALQLAIGQHGAELARPENEENLWHRDPGAWMRDHDARQPESRPENERG